MKTAPSLSVLLMSVISGVAFLNVASGRSLDRIQISGKEYVRAADWARANGLEGRWLRRDEVFRVSNGNAKMDLTMESRDAEINGVQIWLSFPAVHRNGA